MKSSRRAAYWCCWLLAGAGCVATPKAEFRLRPPPSAVTPAEFPGAVAFLQGFSPLAAPGWQVGDEVLYGLRLRTGDTVKHRLLHVRIDEVVAVDDDGRPLPPSCWPIVVNGEEQQFCTELSRVALTVADGSGNVLGRSRPLLPRDYLAQGFAPACRLVQQRIREHPELVGLDAFYDGLGTRVFAEAVVCTMALVQMVQGDEVLSPLLWEVVQRPSLWSVAANLGVAVVVRPRFHAMVAVAAPVAAAAAGPVWSVPISLLVNDTMALQADMVVGESLPPLALGGGILAATARHPTDPNVEFSMLLLAARCGPAAAQRSVIIGREIALDSR